MMSSSSYPYLTNCIPFIDRCILNNALKNIVKKPIFYTKKEIIRKKERFR